MTAGILPYIRGEKTVPGLSPGVGAGMQVELSYGTAGRLQVQVDPQRRFVVHRGPVSRSDVRARLKRQLSAPLDFPPLEQACLPDDRIVLAVDRETPCLPELVAGIWEVLSQRGVPAENLLVLQPVPPTGTTLPDPRRLLPPADRDRVHWQIHDPADPKAQAYLATTARGERIYLARELIDADVTIAVGAIAFDPLLGCRGTHSAFFPGLSNAETIVAARGEGHRELDPDDIRPQRQTVDEVAWLLGTLFAVQVVPGAGGGAADVFAGASESVFRRGRQLLNEYWRVPVPERVDLVVVGIDAPEGGTTWDHVGTALASAQRIVARGGRLVVLSDLNREPGPALDLLRRHHSAREALSQIRKLGTDDMLAAMQIASAADWARVFFLSQLPGDVIDELSMAPLDHEREALKLLAGDESCVLLGAAQHAWTEIRPE